MKTGRTENETAPLQGVCRFYGRGRQDRDCCRRCRIKGACQEAYIPATTAESKMIRLDVFEKASDAFFEDVNIRPADWDEPVFSMAEVFEVIHRLLDMDLRTLDYLAEVFQSPGITFTALAKKRGISRQAVHKWLKAEVERHPELRPVIFSHSKTLKEKKGGGDVQE